MESQNKQIISYKYVWVCMIALTMSFVSISCIKDADDEEIPQPSEVPTDTIANDSAAVVVDTDFRVSIELLQTEWMAEYTGYDPMLNAVSAIQRLIYFSPDGFYDSHVRGIANVADTTVTEFKEFEHEHGTYSFDVENQTMTYAVEYDSLLNFGANVMVYYPGKMIRGTIKKEYAEDIKFSKEQEGKRNWIRTDDNLMSPTDHTAHIIYVMKNQ